MSDKIQFGVVGGYGATGRVVVSELCRSCSGEILIGGRDLSKAEKAAAEFPGRVSAARVDVLDAKSLDDFCSRCSIIVNTAGPVILLQDRVAQAAFRKHCHYIDAAGLLAVKEGMLPHSREIAGLGLSFVISAGLLPGISELLPVYAVAKAKMKMDSCESLSVYFGDTGAWSGNALREAAWLIHQRRTQGAGYFRNGERIKVGALKALKRVDLGGRIGRRRFYMTSIPELDEVGSKLADLTLYPYGCLPGLSTTLAATLVRLLPLPPSVGAGLIRAATRMNRLPMGGFVVARVAGRWKERSAALTVEMVYEENQGYWINGLVPAIVARMIAEHNGVCPGVHFLASAVDPVALVPAIRKSGIEVTEIFEAGDLPLRPKRR